MTAAGPLLGCLVTGSFIIENIFAIPGIGRYYVTSVAGRDYSTVMGITVLLSILIIVANMVVDILYGYPRPAHARGAQLMVAEPAEEATPRVGRRARATSSATRPARRSSRRASGATRSAASRTTRRRVISMVAFVIMLLYVVIVPFVSPVRPERRRLQPRVPDAEHGRHFVRHRRVRPRPLRAHRARRPDLDRHRLRRRRSRSWSSASSTARSRASSAAGSTTR